MVSTLAQQRAFHVTKLIETKQRMITGAAKMPVVGSALLLAVGLAHGTVHVQDQFPHGSVFLEPINPAPGQLRQRLQVVCLGQHLGLETSHLAGGGCRPLRGPATDHMPHGGINREPFGVIGVLIPQF
jgi:hypothetical protein